MVAGYGFGAGALSLGGLGEEEGGGGALRALEGITTVGSLSS